MLSNKIPLEALQISHQSQADQIAWLKANKAAILAQAEAYEANLGAPITIDPSTWLGYKVPSERIPTVRRFLNTRFGVLEIAVRNKTVNKNILGYLFGIVKQLV